MFFCLAVATIIVFFIGIGICNPIYDIQAECANIGGVMIDIFPYSCFTKRVNTANQLDLELLAQTYCTEMDEHYTIGHLPWLATKAQTFDMLEALSDLNYAVSGMFQTNSDDEPGGNWYYVGKDATVGLFGPLPDQTNGSNLRFDIWSADIQPSDMDNPAGDRCEGFHEQTTCIIGILSYAKYSLSYTYGNLCNPPYKYDQAICQYDYRFARQVFKGRLDRGMLKDIVGVRSLPNTQFVIECANACSEAPICSMYFYDTSDQMCRISFIPVDFIDNVTEAPSNYQKLYLRMLL